MPASSLDIKKLAPLALAVLVLAAAIYFIPKHWNKAASVPPAAGPGEYLFCTWNVENLFDDQNDKRNQVDEEYDNWFAENASDRELKYKHLAEALVKMNGGK